MISKVLDFTLKLLGILALVAATHLLVLHIKELDLLQHLFIRAYIVNYLLALMIFITLEWAKKKYLSSLGFIYMGSSLVKFIFFFALFYPTYNMDENVEKQEFITFFIPYAAALIYETTHLVRILNRETNITKE